jgi:SPP1 gp7 family putative phage head morphogenesis protein
MFHPRATRLRRRQRTLRAVRPSRATELWYRAQLDGIVDRLEQSGEVVASEMRPHFMMRDAFAPGLDELLARLVHRIGRIDILAERLVNVADRLSLVRRGLADVDERLAAAIHDSIGLDISPILRMQSGDISPIGAALHRKAIENVKLIKSIPAEYFSRIRAVVSRDWESGARWEQVAESIQRTNEITRNRAALIARDQTSKMNAALNEVRQTGLGIAEYTWSGALDQRERPSHRAMEGKRCRWNAPPEVDGENVHPGMAVNCRCTALPIVNLDALGPEGVHFSEAA